MFVIFNNESKSKYHMVAIVSFMLLGGCTSYIGMENVDESRHYYTGSALIEFVAPKLSDKALLSNRDAYFEVWVQVDSFGAIEDLGYVARDIEEEHYADSDWHLDLVNAAITAVRKWRFDPMIIDGESTGEIHVFIFHVSLYNGLNRWIIKDVVGPAIYDSEVSGAPKLPYAL